jgi:spore germination cell wall hydrolase CwlJ-like protein
LGGVILGLTFTAACMAVAQPSPDQARAQSFGQAAKAGYVAAQAISRPVPVVPARGEPMAQASQAAPPHPATAPTSELNCLAAAVYYEARGEALAGRAAVAQVVLNRVHRGAFPKSVCGVVFQGQRDGACQFSFACNGVMRGRREPAAWVDARAVAARALAGLVMPTVGKAMWFHCARGGAGHDGGVRLGRQVFFTTLVSGRAFKPRQHVAESAPTSDATPVQLASAATSTGS